MRASPEWLDDGSEIVTHDAKQVAASTKLPVGLVRESLWILNRRSWADFDRMAIPEDLGQWSLRRKKFRQLRTALERARTHFEHLLFEDELGRQAFAHVAGERIVDDLEAVERLEADMAKADMSGRPGSTRQPDGWTCVARLFEREGHTKDEFKSFLAEVGYPGEGDAAWDDRHDRAPSDYEIEPAEAYERWWASQTAQKVVE